MKKYYSHKSSTSESADSIVQNSQKSSSSFSRRGFLGLAATGTALMGLTACGGPEVTSNLNKKIPTDIDFSKVKPAPEIQFWSTHPGSSQKIEQDIIDQFHKSQSDITVELVTAGSTYDEGAQKFQTAQAGGQIPALITMSDVWWFRCLLNDTIIPVDNVMETAKNNVKTYVDSFYTDYYFSKLHWAIPYARSTPLFFYNKEMWKNAGIEDRAPQSWAELQSWGKKIKETVGKNVTAFQHAAPSDYAAWTWQNNLWGNSSGWSHKWDVTVNAPDSISSISAIQDSVYSEGWAGVASVDSGSDFSAEITASTITSTGSMSEIVEAAPFEVGVGYMPQGPNKDPKVCPTGGAGLVIAKKQDKSHQLSAAIFATFLTNAKNSLTYAEQTGYIPTRKNSDLESLYSTLPLTKTAISQLKNTRSQDYARVFIPGADRILTDTCARILGENKKVTSELSTAQQTIKSLYESEVKPYINTSTT